MNGGSTSNRTPPQRQLPRMLLLIHDSTLNPSTSQQLSHALRCRNAINVLRVHQGIRTHRAPTEGSQDKGSCVRPPRFDRWTGKFSSDEVCVGVPTHRSMHSLP